MATPTYGPRARRRCLRVGTLVESMVAPGDAGGGTEPPPLAVVTGRDGTGARVADTGGRRPSPPDAEAVVGAARVVRGICRPEETPRDPWRRRHGRSSTIIVTAGHAPPSQHVAAPRCSCGVWLVQRTRARAPCDGHLPLPWQLPTPPPCVAALPIPHRPPRVSVPSGAAWAPAVPLLSLAPPATTAAAPSPHPACATPSYVGGAPAGTLRMPPRHGASLSSPSSSSCPARERQ